VSPLRDGEAHDVWVVAHGLVYLRKHSRRCVEYREPVRALVHVPAVLAHAVGQVAQAEELDAAEDGVCAEDGDARALDGCGDERPAAEGALCWPRDDEHLVQRHAMLYC